MRRFRFILPVFLIASLTVTPAAAKTVPVDNQVAPVTVQSHHGPVRAASDCPGMAHTSETSGHAQHVTGSNGPCADCDKQVPCKADLCPLKCFKVFGAPTETARSGDLQVERHEPLPLPAYEPASWEPQPPPPRT